MITNPKNDVKQAWDGKIKRTRGADIYFSPAPLPVHKFSFKIITAQCIPLF